MTSDLLPRRLSALIVLLLCAALPGLLQAHPHGWIDLRMRLVLDDGGRLTALQQSWRMDPFYSLVILEELGRAEEGESLEAGLDQLGVDIRDNLSSQGYFTELDIGGDPVLFGEVSEYTVLERGGRVEFVFLLPLAQPRALEGRTLRYRVFDPTYYLEVVHEADGDMPDDDALVVGGETTCEARILPADPDPQRILEAARLDTDDQSEPGLGRHFAETGEVTCA